MLLRSYFLPSYPHPLHNHISHTKHPDILSAFSCLPFPLLVTPVLLLFSLEQKSLCKGHHFLGTQTSSLNTARLIVCVMLSRVNFLTVTRGHACSVDQLRPTLFDAMDCSPPGSSVHGIFQARVLELHVISNSRGSS